jgi:hypothetical protein
MLDRALVFSVRVINRSEEKVDCRTGFQFQGLGQMSGLLLFRYPRARIKRACAAEDSSGPTGVRAGIRMWVRRRCWITGRNGSKHQLRFRELDEHSRPG